MPVEKGIIRKSPSTILLMFSGNMHTNVLSDTQVELVPFKRIPIFEDFDQLHLLINNVKITFFSYPFQILHPVKIDSFITIPTLLSLAAMKAFALGRRARWKDYVDLYFISKDHYSLDEIIKQGEKLFKPECNPKIFRTQLSYFNDISYREKITYLTGFEVDEKEVKKNLIEYSLK